MSRPADLTFAVKQALKFCMEVNQSCSGCRGLSRDQKKIGETADEKLKGSKLRNLIITV
jgi:hypothetical protein